MFGYQLQLALLGHTIVSMCSRVDNLPFMGTSQHIFVGAKFCIIVNFLGGKGKFFVAIFLFIEKKSPKKEQFLE